MSAAADIIREVYARLNARTSDLLQDWTIERQPVAKVEASEDFPSLQIGLPKIGEEVIGSTLVTVIITFAFAVTTLRSDSANDSAVIESSVADHFDKLDALRNSLELDQAGTTSDPLLASNLIEPMQWSSRTTQVMAGSYGTELNLTLRSRAVTRGSR